METTLMKIGESDVSSESKVIGNTKYPIYETVDEILNHTEYGLGEQKLLDLINAQIKTNAMNTLRTARTKGPTKSALRSEAVNEIVSEIANGDHAECIGNPDVLNALIERRMSQIEARMKEAADLQIAAVGSSTGEDEE